MSRLTLLQPWCIEDELRIITGLIAETADSTCIKSHCSVTKHPGHDKVSTQRLLSIRLAKEVYTAQKGKNVKNCELPKKMSEWIC